MNSPAKKRRKNDYHASNQPVRSLDFFFNKQKNAASGITAKQPHTASDGPAQKDNLDKALTDEELARKLQDEWDAEYNRINGSSNKADDGDVAGKPRSDGIALPARLEAVVIDNTVKPSILAEASTREEPTVSTRTTGPEKNTLSLQSTATEEDIICSNIPFDESPLTFDPWKYIPELQKHWALDGGHATYALLTRCFILVNSTTSRIKIVDTLVNLLRTIIEGDPESLLPAVWLATNSIAPPYIDVELGVGSSVINKALKKVCGLDNASLRALNNKYGDAGDVAFEAKKRQSFTLRKPKPLTIRSVFDTLHKIANAKGQGSVDVKQRLVERLLQDARGAEESRYIMRTLVQHLRIGAVKTTMLIALSRAFLLSRPPGATFPNRSQSELATLSKEALRETYAPGEEIVKACFARRPNYNDLVPALLEIGVCDELLVRCGLALHIPLRPMLGGITRDLGEMLTKLQGRDFSCEYKYDGQRAQVHCDDRGKVTIFSRHLEVMTNKYPDLVALVPKIRGEGVSSFIMEGEVVAIDRDTGELRTFQTLANRARKDVVINTVKIEVCLFAFDLMYLNGEELLNRPFRERRNLLRSLFIEIPHHFTWVKSLDATSADADAVSDFFKSATDLKCEGIMVKVLDNLPNPDLLADADADPDAIAEQLSLPPPTPQKRKAAVAAAAKPKKKAGASAADDDVPAEKPKTRRKPLLSTYEPDKRLDSWLKVKKDYNTSADTIDLIPVGAWHGMGRKCKWWSPILLAVRNPETGCLEAVTKCMSGFSDKFYQANRAKYDPDGGGGGGGDDDGEGEGPRNVISKPSYVEYAGRPAVWFEPQEVWECAFADITLSPTYTAALGLVSEERGLSLRFPRFLRVREDKGIEEASTSEFLAELYRKQEARAPKKGEEKGGEGEAEEEEW